MRLECVCLCACTCVSVCVCAGDSWHHLVETSSVDSAQPLDYQIPLCPCCHGYCSTLDVGNLETVSSNRNKSRRVWLNEQQYYWYSEEVGQVSLGGLFCSLIFCT